MAIGSEIRKSDLYVGDGVQTKFTFAFKLLAASDAEVRVAPEDGTEEVLAKSAYACSLNEDQDNNPGGAVTLAEPLAQGATLVVISAEEALQPAVFTNRGAFYPTVLNDSLDRLTILIQQLKENIGRAIVTDATDTMTPSELKQKLLDAAESATVVAKGYAESAKQSADSAAASEEKTAEYAGAATIVAPIATEVKTVAGIASDVTAVSGVKSEVKTVAGIAGDVTKVANIAEETKAVGGNIATVSRATGLLDHTADIAALSPHVGDLHRVGQDLLASDAKDISYDFGMVSDDVETVSTVTGGILKSVADHLDDCIHPVGQKIDEVHNVATNLDTISRATGLLDHTADIAALSPHIDDLHRVGQDLLVTDAADKSYDYGAVSDAVEPAAVVTGGILKQVADHIDDCIHPVAAKLDDIHAVSTVAGDVTKVATITEDVKLAASVAGDIEGVRVVKEHADEVHVVGQDLQSLTVPSLDFGEVTEEAHPMATLTGGYIKKVAEHIDDCIHPVGQKIDEVHNVATNLATISRATGLLDHTADIAALSPHLDDLHRVGQDLLVTDAIDKSYDYGAVSDDVELTATVTGGVLKQVADHVEDCIHPVAQRLDDIHAVGENIEAVKTVASNLDPINAVAEMMATDYAKIFEEGVS